ncbi:Uncharacterized protein dnm_051910 [Desulfonema magnum]|uniref:Uncharacterized protein n=1 Tax=Desulfonema magnum TaxID=45655 RepID=A0A975GPS0_9BACT|nr:Uncharacterized protein dnm_051910 [Desulfonema magnum]
MILFVHEIFPLCFIRLSDFYSYPDKSFCFLFLFSISKVLYISL